MTRRRREKCQVNTDPQFTGNLIEQTNERIGSQQPLLPASGEESAKRENESVDDFLKKKEKVST
jgi:hypothetical protein